MLLVRSVCSLVLLAIVCAPSGALANPPAVISACPEVVPSPPLLYVSDYFSFAGRDEEGAVFFAIDNNRGRDGAQYQAEHFVVLRDEQQGWVDLAGNGAYANAAGALATIPDSREFHFRGSVADGFTMVGATNRRTLDIDPIVLRMDTRDGDARMQMGSAGARLQWHGRRIEGRVIHEYLCLPNFNRLTRFHWGVWREFQGFYLRDATGTDVYLHSQLSPRMSGLLGARAGFAVIDGVSEAMHDIEVDVLSREYAIGWYRWPMPWRISWSGARGRAVLMLVQDERRTIATWMVGGFALGVPRGELDYEGIKRPMAGLMETIM